MEVRIDLDVPGQEALALGRELYPWYFTVKPLDGTYSSLSKGCVTVGEAKLELPIPETRIATVLESLADRERELRAQLNEDLAELEVRRANLLSISYSPATSQESGDD